MEKLIVLTGTVWGNRLLGFLDGRGAPYALWKRFSVSALERGAVLADASEAPACLSKKRRELCEAAGAEYLRLGSEGAYGELIGRLAGSSPQERGLWDHFPLFVPTEGKCVLVVGGGTIATRRVKTLLRFSWKVTVVSPEASVELQALAHSGELLWERRRFCEADVLGMFLVVAATDRRDVNQTVGAAAKKAGCYVSVADAREECTCYFPAIAENRQVLAGIAGNGATHRETSRAAKRIRAALGEELPGCREERLAKER